MDRRDDPEVGAEVANPDEDVLELGSRRRLPRPVWLIAGVAAVALIVGLAISHRSGPSAAGPSPPVPPPESSSIPATVSSGAPARLLGDRLPLASTSPALAVAISERVTWVLQPGRITVLDDLTSRRSGASVPTAVSDIGSSPKLVLDPSPSAALWLVLDRGSSTRVIELNAFTLTRRRDLRVPAVNGAAALNGHLYLTSGARLIDIGPSGPPRRISVPGAGLGAIAADPRRGRLLVLDFGAPTHLWVYKPGAGVSRTTVSLPLGKGTIAVVGDTVWVGGFSGDGALLIRLDPAPPIRWVAISPVTDKLAPGAEIVAAGQRVLWVRSARRPDDLWCVTSGGGDDQHWNLPGAVASTAGIAVISSETGASVLRLDGCAG